jgi:endonuclease/exonuclease/phosphatase family metal-dependent hydrolase
MKTELATPVEFYECSFSDSSKPLQWRPASSRNAVTDRIDSLRLVTWNIWFDKLEQDRRYSSVLKELTSIPSVDVIALQEVTSAFLEMIQVDSIIQKDWLLTDHRDANHRQQITENWYGNIFLVRRKWAGNIRGWVIKFQTSKLGRFLVTVEIFQRDASVV